LKGYFRAIAAHQAAPYGNLIISKGDVLQAETRPSEWPGWVWVTTSNQVSGWMPLAYLDPDGAAWRAVCDYRDVELSVQPADTLEVLYTQDQWAWCQPAQGEPGWVPLAVLERLNT